MLQLFEIDDIAPSYFAAFFTMLFRKHDLFKLFY